MPPSRRQGKGISTSSPHTPSTHLAPDGDEYREVDDESSLREATQDQRLRRLVEDG